MDGIGHGPLLGERPLSVDTVTRLPGRVGATLDDNLSPAGKPRTRRAGLVASGVRQESLESYAREM